MTMRRIFQLSALLTAPLFLWACGGDDADPGPDVPMMEEAADPGPMPMGEMDHMVITLNPRNDSGVSGEAMAMHTAESVVVVVEVNGLPGEGEYAAHIHAGSCEAGGGVAAPLNPVMGLADGTGSSTTTLEADALSADGSYFIMVHGEGGAPIACGDVEGHGH